MENKVRESETLYTNYVAKRTETKQRNGDVSGVKMVGMESEDGRQVNECAVSDRLTC
jgi:hypothetical protein